MSWLDKLLPFKTAADNLTGTFDTWVEEKTIDRDKAIELSTHVKTLQIGLEKSAMDLETKELELKSALLELKEKSYQMELQTKTTPKADAFHKLARTLLAFYLATVNALLVAFSGSEWLDITIDGNVMAILGIGATGAGIYTYQKGKGTEIK